MSFSFDPAALEAIIAQPAVQTRMASLAAPTILTDAKLNCSVRYPGGMVRNPAPGTVNGGTGVYARSGAFWQTLQLSISVTGGLAFSSPIVSPRKGFDYGQALIDGRAPFIGPYRLLPPEYYV